ncbi:MAG: hypothetical protein NWF05_00880 [Candidatus Bathyarchaeota archaeon]|nr:hypothetical protein [Candidatus Bathyarchaeota archaeon]
MKYPMMCIQAFRSFQDAMRDLDEWVKTFPERYDVIVGIPRSGMFVASYIATKLGVPLSTPDDFVRNEIWFTCVLKKPTDIHKILLVDDGVGRIDGQMKQNFYKIKTVFPTLEIKRASLYIYKNAVEAVDRYYDYLDDNHLNREEWNLLHRKYGTLGVDMDGVLCHDWDPARYRTYETFLQTAEPFMIPKFKIDFIITNRHKKYANETSGVA